MAKETYTITCPACQAVLTVKPEWAGRSAKCNKCQHALVIPPPPTASAPSAPVAPAPAAAPLAAAATAREAAAPVNLAALRSSSESMLRIVCLIASIVIYLVLIVTIVGIFYYLAIVLFSWIALSIMLAEIRGNGIKVGPDQLPAVYQSASRAARLFGLSEVPDVFVVQQGGILNAFACRWAFRGHVVLFSDLVDACGDDTQELDMVVAHEMGHLALGHLTWHWILLPAKLVPFLSQAYSRACEYSADRCGWAGCTNKQAAMRGLLILAAGGHCGRAASLAAFLKQHAQVDGFWLTLVGLFATHPWITRRVEALHEMSAGASV